MFQLDLNPFQEAMKDAVLRIKRLERNISYNKAVEVRKKCFPKLKQGVSQLFESSAQEIYKELERTVKTGQGVFIKKFSCVYEIRKDPTAEDISSWKRDVQLEPEIISGIKTTKSKKSNTSRIDAKGKQRIILALKNRLILAFIKTQACVSVVLSSEPSFRPDIDNPKSPNS